MTNSISQDLFTLNTRRLGKVAEIFVANLLNANDSEVSNYDLVDKTYKKVEVKFSRVMTKHKSRITRDNVLEQIKLGNEVNRAIKYEKRFDVPFDSNIQQVKADEFDSLFYGLFFADKVMVFCVNSQDVKQIKGYSNVQHRNNHGEGQFHINESNLIWHEENHLFNVYSYDDFISIIDN